MTRFAQPDDIVVVRQSRGGEERIPFSQSDVIEGGCLDQNIVLETSDTVVVP
jgi:hypothetical protein